jgi:hypothetical protein
VATIFPTHHLSIQLELLSFATAQLPSNISRRLLQHQVSTPLSIPSYAIMVTEHDAYRVIGHIPVFNFFYSGIRAAVYAGQGDIAEAQRSGIGMIPFAHSGREAAEAAVNALKSQALDMAKTAPGKILDLVLAFCKANAWWIGISVAALIVAVYLYVWWKRTADKAKEKRQELRLKAMIGKAVRAALTQLQQPMVSEGDLDDLITASIKA